MIPISEKEVELHKKIFSYILKFFFFKRKKKKGEAALKNKYLEGCFFFLMEEIFKKLINI